MKNRDLHIVPARGWGVKKEGNKRNIFITLTKSQAIEIGRKIAKKEKSELIIHNKDGKIKDKDSFGNDPFPARDKVHLISYPVETYPESNLIFLKWNNLSFKIKRHFPYKHHR